VNTADSLNNRIQYQKWSSPAVGCSSAYVVLSHYIFLSFDGNTNSQLSIISQGIAARFARRQASSEHAYLHARGFTLLGKLARIILEDAGIVITPKSRL
jgi:hypothetical protein